MKQLHFCLVISFIFVFNCSKKQDRELQNYKIISNCIDTLIASNEMYNKADYLINPYCGNFEFNNYTNKYYSQHGGMKAGSRDEVFKKLNWNGSFFNKVKTNVNSLYNGECYKQMSKELSKKGSSNLVTFSGIHENIVFVEIIDFCSPIKLEELNLKEDYLKRPRSNISSLVLLLENEKVKEIFTDNYISFEMQCDSIN